MALPATVRVKLSSEAAESISLTPVVVQELAIRELVEHMLGVTGKDIPRIREILLRGTLVSGASRFRWAGLDADPDGLNELLETFPDAEPARQFAADRCIRAILRGGRQAIEVTREAGQRKSLFQRGTFWDLLMDVIACSPSKYAGYSYRDRADRFHREFQPVEADRIRAGAPAVKYSTLRDLIQATAFVQAELYVTR